MLSKTICLRISHIGKPVWNMHHGPCGLRREGCDAETHTNMELEVKAPQLHALQLGLL